MKLGESLQAYRKRAGLSQEELAEICEISRQAIAKWESGESVPTMDKLIFLADHYGVTLDELAGRVEKDDYMRLAEIIERLVPDVDRCDEVCDEMTNEFVAMVCKFITHAKSTLKMDPKTILEGVKTVFLSCDKE